MDWEGFGARSAIFILGACLNLPSGCRAAWVAYACCLMVLGLSARGLGVWLEGPGTASWGYEDLGQESSWNTLGLAVGGSRPPVT